MPLHCSAIVVITLVLVLIMMVIIFKAMDYFNKKQNDKG